MKQIIIILIILFTQQAFSQNNPCYIEVKKDGDALFKQGRYQEAIAMYQQGLDKCAGLNNTEKNSLQNKINEIQTTLKNIEKDQERQREKENEENKRKLAEEEKKRQLSEKKKRDYEKWIWAKEKNTIEAVKEYLAEYCYNDYDYTCLYKKQANQLIENLTIEEELIKADKSYHEKEYEKAITTYSKYYNKLDQIRTSFLARSYLKLNNYTKSLEVYTTLNNNYPDDGNYYHQLGYIYSSANSSIKDCKKSEDFYLKAIAKYNTENDKSTTYNNLGWLYINGCGNTISKDIKKAYLYFKKACNLNNESGCKGMKEVDNIQANNLLIKNTFSLFKKGKYKECFSEMKKLADGGNAEAMYYTGWMLFYGKGTSAETWLAKTYLSKACSKKISKACKLKQQL